VSSLLALARTRGIARVTSSQIVARFPLGMLSLALLIHLRATSGSYAVAGSAVAAWCVGEGIAGPLAGRLLSRYGVVRVVGSTAAVCAMVIAVIASDLRGWVPVLLCAIGGMAVPPVAQAVRSLYPALVPAGLLAAVFAVDASSQEVIWTLGPLLAATLATVSTSTPLLVAAALVLVGTGWFLSLRVVRHRPVDAHRPARGFGRTLANPSVIVAVLTSAMLVASYSALEVAVLDRFGSDAGRTGLAIAVSSIGSLLGGLTFGPRVRGLGALTVATGTVCVFTAAAAIAPGQLLFLAAMFLSGLGFAPASAYLSTLVSTTVRASESGEAFGWVATGSLIGAAGGTAAAGFGVDLSGEGAAFVVAVGVGAAGAAVPLATMLLGRGRRAARIRNLS
jgi:MFS family permease